jgi:glycosyltransferase involved in cell wall biosynthesis
MAVSIIIPCFKDSSTLGRALDSVYAQTYKVDEVVVINDASPESDLIEAVIKRYPDVKYFVNEKNIGLAASRNRGVRASSGDIVCFLDADDELHPQKIEIQVSFYKSNIAISCNVFQNFDPQKYNQLRFYDYAPPYSVFSNSLSLVRWNQLTGASLMISRELFLSFGGYDETLRSCEDFDLWLRLLDSKIVAYNIELPLYLYKHNEQGLSRNPPSISYWELEVVKKYHARVRRLTSRVEGENFTLGIWLFKHFVRSARYRNSELLTTTYCNLKLLDQWPITRSFILFLRVIGLTELIGSFLAYRDNASKIA